MRLSNSIMAIVAGVALAGCERATDSGGRQPSVNQNAATRPAAEDEHHADGHTEGAALNLGSTTVGGLTVRAARDAGEIRAGGEVAADAWINDGLGDPAAVRFWVGAANAEGSIKARAEVKDGHWHTHVEAPDPLPAGALLWVEIEARDGQKYVASFGLNP
jgi:hypothetical protein